MDNPTHSEEAALATPGYTCLALPRTSQKEPTSAALVVLPCPPPTSGCRRDDAKVKGTLGNGRVVPFCRYHSDPTAAPHGRHVHLKAGHRVIKNLLPSFFLLLFAPPSGVPILIKEVGGNPSK